MKNKKENKSKLLCLCIIVMLIAIMPFSVVPVVVEASSPYVVYVNGTTEGNDITGDGTSTQPFKSFEKAQQVAISNKTDDQDILIMVSGMINVNTSLIWTGSTNYETIIQRDASYKGGLVLISDGTGQLTVSNIIFDGNNVNAQGNLISITASGTSANRRLALSVDSCSFINNKDTSSGGAGGAIGVLGSYINIKIKNSLINNNFANSNAGGIRFASGVSSTMTIEDSVISNNSTALAGGGGIVSTPGAGSLLTLKNVVIDGNKATGSGGGGIIVQGAQCDIIDSKITNNSVFSNATSALGLGGGGIKVMSSISTSTVNIVGTLIQGNSVNSLTNGKVESGGGVSVMSGTLSIADSVITQNTSNNDGGGIHVAGGTVNITTTQIIKNSAKQIPGMTYSYNCSGGGMIILGGTVNLNDNNIIRENYTEYTTTSDNIHIATGTTVNVSGINDITDNFYLTAGAVLTLTKGFDSIAKRIFPIRSASSTLGTVLVKPSVKLVTTIPYQYNFSLQTSPYGIDVNIVNKTLVIANGYTISTSTDGNGIILPGGDTHVSNGGFQDFKIIPNFGYKISDVLVDGLSVTTGDNYEFTDVTNNHTLSVTFDLIEVPPTEYIIEAIAFENGTIYPEGNVNVSEGSNQEFTFTPDIGFVIADVLVDGISVGAPINYQFLIVESNHRIEVLFEPESIASTDYAITASVGPNGSISPNGVHYINKGENQIFTIKPNPGFEIEGVLVDSVNVGIIDSYEFQNVEVNHTIHATFRLIQYNIDASASACGEIEPAGIVLVSHSDNQTFMIKPNTGCKLVKVIVDGEDKENINSYTFKHIQEGHSIYVEFMEVDPRNHEGDGNPTPTPEPSISPTNHLIIKATTDAGGGISPLGEVFVPYGGNQGFEITAYQGYEIESVWIDDVNAGIITDYLFRDVKVNHTIHVSMRVENQETIQTGYSSINTNNAKNDKSESEVILNKNIKVIVHEMNKFTKIKKIKSWALVNLVITILSVLLSLILQLPITEKNKNNLKTQWIYRLLSVALTIGLIIYFCYTQNMNYSMQVYDKFTGVMTLCVIGNILCFYFERIHGNSSRQT